MDGQHATVMSGPLAMRFVLVPPGEFSFGVPEPRYPSLPAERPGHRIQINRAYYMAEMPVTNAQYWRFLDASGYDGTQQADEYYLKSPRIRRNEAGWESFPIVDVSWHNAVAFCEWLSVQQGAVVRLPTEPEWEYACKAGCTSQFFCGEGGTDAARFAWFDENSGARIQPVGQLAPNPWGLYDMLGNVFQWCHGSEGVLDAKEVDLSREDYRVARGSSFRMRAECIQCTNRLDFLANGAADIIGFRVEWHEANEAKTRANS